MILEERLAEMTFNQALQYLIDTAGQVSYLKPTVYSSVFRDGRRSWLSDHVKNFNSYKRWETAMGDVTWLFLSGGLKRVQDKPRIFRYTYYPKYANIAPDVFWVVTGWCEGYWASFNTWEGALAHVRWLYNSDNICKRTRPTAWPGNTAAPVEQG